MRIEQIIDGVLAREGGYVDHPSDPGGATMHGITEAVARAAGYTGAMRSLPIDLARSIIRNQYYVKPGFALVEPLSARIAEELLDTAVNMGPRKPSQWLQQLLNGLNRQGADYPDLVADGQIGPTTAGALKAFLATRGADGESVMLCGLNALQGAEYLRLTLARESNEAFLYGWLRNRVAVT